MQVPAAMKLAVVPETVQTVEVVEAKLTGRPELAVAESISGVPYVWSEIVPKVIVWASPLTVKVCETGVAAA